MIWKPWLSTHRGHAAIVVVALLLTAPALGTGLVADDLFHELMLRTDPGVGENLSRPFDLFAFATGDISANHRLMDEGVFPWWTDPTVKLAFWRPLTCLTHLLDHQLGAHNAFLMHLQSMIWFAVLLLGVASLYRRLLVPAWVAGLALLLYAIDDARAPAVAWVANRNALVSMAFAVPALVFHVKWRRDGDRRARWLAPALLGMGLLGGETALAVVGYLVAYACCLDRGNARERVLSLLPYAFVLLLWQVGYTWTGHGVAGSGVYVDPARAPLAFLRVTTVRMPLLLSAALLGPWADLWEPLALYGKSLTPWLFGWSTVVVGVFAVLILPLAKRDRVTRFFAIGCVLSTVPMCSTFVHDRLLMVPCLGSMALVARLIAAWISEARQHRRARSVGVGVLALAHLMIAPLFLPVRSYAAVGESRRLLSRAYDSIASDATISNKTVVLVNPPFDPFASYFPLARQVERRPRPKHLRWLATGATALRIERTDDRTLLVEAESGWLSTTSERMLRNPETASARAGDRVDLTDVSFEVVRVSDRRPRQIRVRFDVPLEDAGLVWLQWSHDERGYVPFRPPAVGANVEIAAVDMRRALSFMTGGARAGATRDAVQGGAASP